MVRSLSREKIYVRCGKREGIVQRDQRGEIAWGNGEGGKVVVIKSQKFIYMKRNPHEMNPLKEIK